MCFALKYGTWRMERPARYAVNALVAGGFAPLPALVLAARGIDTLEKAERYLSVDAPLDDPFSMTDMGLAAARVAYAMEKGEKIAVFGDYDVDGITATCLLTDFLRRHGTNCVSYIPGRLEEGYGLNEQALRYLHGQGVQLIVTVDCGITAAKEARLCKELGIDLIITDHHECKDALPEAIAVVDPHRKDDGYPHRNLSGVGVAFKLAAALCGSQEEILSQYADMVCLGTVADVMPLQGENRVFVSKGLEMLRHTKRPGLAALMEQAGCCPESLSASSIGYVLAPRINAAGRMGKIDLAVELFLTDDPQKGAELATALCELNRQRQAVESEIYRQAVDMLPDDRPPEAIVLADESWHQGVVGIVASRLAEEFCCPAFLICLDGDHGKASSRSYGGFNLFTSLSVLSPLLESYGGHELAAGFTISRQKIGEFRQEICAMAAGFYDGTGPRTVLDIDCVIRPEELTLRSVEALEVLEPCGCCCPRPVFAMEQLQIQKITMVGNGRHMRLRLQQGHAVVNAIYFSAATECDCIAEGDWVDIAFTVQMNEYRGARSVQLNLLDIRPSCAKPCSADTSLYQKLRTGALEAQEAVLLTPTRQQQADVWRYLAGCGGVVREAPACLCRKIVRRSGRSLDLPLMLVCLDLFAEAGLLRIERQQRYFTITLTSTGGKADLNQCRTMQMLRRLKES